MVVGVHVCAGHGISGKKGLYFGRVRDFGPNKGIVYRYARRMEADVHFFQGRQQNKYIKFRYSSKVGENIENSGKNYCYF
ncbi:hypothetical protein PbDSM24746_46530 [Paenibacillus macerans]|nr:hypothetical protein PbDSM24746_46530 [Paenibacillus macerans]GBK70917.1 hypothetical protein PbJCM17693_46250 [Paenibacillus macerans]GIP13218.1 hypothetical protein J1TS5_53880 [Paenibacillus macerans]